MNVSLPGIGEIEASGHIRAEKPEVTVFLLSTYGREDVASRFEACGGRAFIPKADFGSESLVEAWRQALGRGD